MPLGGLQHFTIEPQDLERSKEFYVDVLGLEIGDRPPLDFPGRRGAEFPASLAFPGTWNQPATPAKIGQPVAG
jgi:catechol 2,3-dioxygenase-like lactoylglutathione lyase family enzyme